MGMQDAWETGGQQVTVDFLLPTGIYLKLDVSPNDTIAAIKKVRGPHFKLCRCFHMCNRTGC